MIPFVIMVLLKPVILLLIIPDITCCIKVGLDVPWFRLDYRAHAGILNRYTLSTAAEAMPSHAKHSNMVAHLSKLVLCFVQAQHERQIDCC